MHRYVFLVLRCRTEWSRPAQTDHVKRTHDYEPFIKGFIESLYHGGLLYALLDRDNDGKKVKKSTAKAKR